MPRARATPAGWAHPLGPCLVDPYPRISSPHCTRMKHMEYEVLAHIIHAFCNFFSLSLMHHFSFVKPLSSSFFLRNFVSFSLSLSLSPSWFSYGTCLADKKGTRPTARWLMAAPAAPDARQRRAQSAREATTPSPWIPVISVFW